MLAINLQRQHRPGHPLEAAGDELPGDLTRFCGERADLQQIGGSHAQRDVFDRITIEAALRGGYAGAARALLRDRMARRAGSVDGYAAARLSLIDAVHARAV